MPRTFEELITTLRNFLRDVTTDTSTPNADLYKTLSFLNEVARVVDQAFSDVLQVFAKYEYVSNEDLLPEKLPVLSVELRSLRTRDHYKQAGDICGQLKVLRLTYESNIEPLVKHLVSPHRWEGLFSLLEEREGLVVELVAEAVGKLQYAIFVYTRYDGFNEYYWSKNKDTMLPSLFTIQTVAAESSETIRNLLAEIHKIKNEILGLSGRQGLLELVNTNRFQLRERVIQVTNDNSVHTQFTTGGDFTGTFTGRDGSNVTTTITQKVSGSSAPDDIKTLIATLAKQIDAVKAVDEKKAKQMLGDFDTLGKEVASEEPRKQWYELSLSGLKEAAQAIGEVGKPIVQTVTQLMAILLASS